MGNSPSKRQSAATRELEKYTQPTGLYPSCPWEAKTARQLIVGRKLAPRVPGCEAKEGYFTQECPICFMFYPDSLNMSTCCNKPICTECYLQIRPPKKAICCPFCNHEAFGVKYTPPLTPEYSPSRSTKKQKSPRQTSDAIGIPTRPAEPASPTPGSVHYASVEERHRLRDSLRTQLSISDRPVTNSPHPNSMASLTDAQRFMATPADAARLEELMLMEAIRRSMHDLNVAKENEGRNGSQSHSPDTHNGSGSGSGSGSARDDGSEADYEEVGPLDASQISLSDNGTVRYSSNPFDAPSPQPVRHNDTPPPRPSTPRWNPFDD